MEHQKRVISILLGIVILVVLLGWFGNFGNGIDENTYQAVFLDNNQIYFGKLSKVSGPYLMLEDIYYMRENPKEAKTDLTLLKYGEEIHQPQDVMFINRDHVLLWQNLKPEGKMVQLIYQQKLQSAVK